MMRQFETVAMTENNPDWEKMTAREHPLYSRADDIRSPFARDYTRVLHSLAYRRLKHKTQVFYNAAGNDHICTRIEHVQHVESVSNTIAKCLGLNEELTRAIALSHDLGHAPFGHQGEKIIGELTEKYLGTDFWHEKNGVYFVDRIELLEDNEMKLQNLNLTYAVRDGIISHCGELDTNALKPRKDYFDLSHFDAPGRYESATWEGCVVKLSDKIAYLGRDIEDAERLGILTGADRKELNAIAGGNNNRVVNTTVIMHSMIIDLCENSSAEGGLRLSKDMSELLNEIKQFNYKHIYRHPVMEPFNRYSRLVIHELFDSLMEYYHRFGSDVVTRLYENNFDRRAYVRNFVEWIVQYTDAGFAIPKKLQEISDRCHNVRIYGDLSDERKYARAVIDYIAGMTDLYAVNAYNEILM